MNGEMLKGHLDAIILAALDAGEAHGYAVIEAIKRQSGGTFILAEGTVYPALHRLEQGGLLSSHWMDPVAGRRRRVYKLTDLGRKSLSERRANWHDFSVAVDCFLATQAPCPI